MANEQQGGRNKDQDVRKTPGTDWNADPSRKGGTPGEESQEGQREGFRKPGEGGRTPDDKPGRGDSGINNP